MIHHRYTWPKLSAISGVTPQGRLYLQLVRGTIKSDGAIGFLRVLLCHIRRKIIVIWDKGPIHRSKAVRIWVEQHPRIVLEPLPGYAYELNADEGVWQHIKGAPLGNFSAANLDELEYRIRGAVRRLHRRPDIVRGFFHRTPLAHV
jgi:transposase